jgi:hypothetical protein
VAGTGFELPPENAGNSSTSVERGADSGALGARIASVDPNLEMLIELWPTLPAETKQRIVELATSTVHKE